MEVLSISAVPASRTAQSAPAQAVPTPQAARTSPTPRVPMTDEMHLSKEAEARSQFEKEQRHVEKVLRRQQAEKDARKAVLAAVLDPTKPAVQTESMGKCVAIAGRILRGDSVPLADEEYLSANAPQLYQQSVLMRQSDETGEDCDSVLTQADVVDGEAARVMTMLRPELRKLLTSPLWEAEPSIPTETFDQHQVG